MKYHVWTTKDWQKLLGRMLVVGGICLSGTGCATVEKGVVDSPWNPDPGVGKAKPGPGVKTIGEFGVAGGLGEAGVLFRSDEKSAGQARRLNVCDSSGVDVVGGVVELPARDVNGYYTLDAIEGFFEVVAKTHPALTRLVSIGESTEGRRIMALRITGAEEECEESCEVEKPRVLITAGVHAREQQPYHFALSLVAELVNGYTSSDYVRRLVDTREVWVIGCVNPDGKVYDFESGGKGDWKYWRKNRRDNGDGGAFGVDLNRNAAVRWGGAEEDTGSITYQGPAPFSEPETKAIRRFVDEVGFVSWLELHSAGGEVFIPRYLTKSEWGVYKGLYDQFHRSQVSSYGPLRGGRELQPAGTQPGVYRAGNTGTLWQWGYYTRGIYTAIMEIRADPTRDASLLHYPSEAFTEAEYRNNGRDAMLSWIDGAGGLTAVRSVKGGAVVLEGEDLEEGVEEKAPGFKIDGLIVDDDLRGDSEGDADTVAEPAELVELVVDLRNSGKAVAEDVWVTLTSLDPAVRVLVEYRSDFGSILPGQNSARRVDAVTPRFVVEIKEGVALGHQAALVFHVFDKGRRRWALPYYLSIGADTSLSQ